MLVKTYAIRGLSEWYGKLVAGSLSVNAEFVGGTASPSGARPAYMVVKDPVKQFVIENSKEFKDGFIYIDMAQEVPGTHPRLVMPKAEAPKKAAAKPAATKAKQESTATEKADVVFSDVKNTQQAIEVLKRYGKGDNVQNKDDAKRIAAELNISFPNL